MKTSKNIKSNQAVTIISMTVYIITILIVVGIMATISTFFYNNLDIIRYSAKYAAEFDKINSSIIKDVKNNKELVINENEKTIIFEDGTTYKYNAEDNSLYRGKERVATNITRFVISTRKITITNVDKQILTVEMIIGNSQKNLLSKRIDYTLKYW